MLVAVISDTHMPKGDRALPAACVERLRAADAILHAGDLVVPAVLDDLRAYGPPVHAVHGNVDTADVRALLPATLTVDLDGMRVAMIHDAGPAAGRLERMRARFGDEADALVFGHSHLPLHERSADGAFQLFNPGSPTERRRAPAHTMGLLHTGARRFELVEV